MSTTSTKGSDAFQSDFLFVTHEPRNVSHVKERRSHAVREHFRKRRWQKANDPLPLRHSYSWRHRKSSPGLEGPDGAKKLNPSRRKPRKVNAPAKLSDAPVAAETEAPVSSEQTEPTSRSAKARGDPGTGTAVEYDTQINALTLVPTAQGISSRAATQSDENAVMVRPPRSPSNLDPFSQMPVNFETKEENLIGHFLKQPNVSWGIDTSKIYSLHRDVIFPNVIQSRSLMLTTLLYASIIKDRVSGVGISNHTLQLWQRSSENVSQRIRDPATRYTPALISGVATVLMMEDLTNRTVNTARHFSGFKELMRRRGGWESLRNFLPQELCLSVQCLLLAKREMSVLPLADPTTSSGFADLWEFSQDCKAFVERVQLFRDLVDRDPSENQVFATSRRTVMAIFAEDNFLLKRLRVATVSGPRGPWFIENVDSQVWFVVLWLILTLGDYRFRPEMCQAVFGKLVVEPFRTHVRHLRSTHGLSWLFISSIDNVPDRRWLALRMVKVMHRLKVETRMKLILRILDVLGSKSDDVLGARYTEEEINDMHDEAMEGLPFQSELGHRTWS